MVGLSKWLLVALSVLALLPQVAMAGGGEFAADGTRGLGRGGTGFTRADDPTVMLRNPALLADLWDDQAMIQSHLLLQASCFHAAGGYGMFNDGGPAVADFGDGPVVTELPPDAQGNPLPEGTPIIDARTDQVLQAPIGNERLDEVCYTGANTFLPSAALSVKLSNDFGVGIGFFPPETMALNQFGNADGTVDTARGRRPAATRFFGAGSNRVVTYFSLLGAFGWRPFSWLRIGAGFQWNMVAFNTRVWSRPSQSINPSTDVRTDTFGRDLFIPGVITSMHIVPFDALDIAVGFKWMQKINTNAKLDLTAGPFGLDQPFQYRTAPNGEILTLDRTQTPFTSHNVSGEITAPPIWSPQLSAGIRYAHRLKPRPTDWEASKEAAGDAVEDHMSTELFDIEVNAIMYLNGVRDFTDFDSSRSQVVLQEFQGTRLTPLENQFGICTDERVLPDSPVPQCVGKFRSRRDVGGKTQYSLRVGADYNLFPGLFALRAGVSYETDGVDPQLFDPTAPDLARTGLHAGFTLRIAEKTDFSFAYALFLQRDVDLAPNETEEGRRWSPRFRSAEYGFKEPAAAADGIGRYEVSYNHPMRPNLLGPFFANPGTGWYDLSIVSASITQHF